MTLTKITSNPKTPDKKESLRSLTLKEKNVLLFLENYMLENGISPSYQEICKNFGFASYNSVQRYLKQLESKGYISLPWGNQKRAITLVQPASALQDNLGEMQDKPIEKALGPEALSIQLLGRVAAGSPIEAYENDEYIDVPTSLVRQPDRTYALRVQGQSMIEDGIFNNDIILVQRQPQANNGEIVVAVVENEATVKRFYSHNKDPRKNTKKLSDTPEQKWIELRPANSSMQSLWYQPNEVQLRGIVVGLIRQF
jgi:repressor LexA